VEANCPELLKAGLVPQPSSAANEGSHKINPTRQQIFGPNFKGVTNQTKEDC